MAENMNPFDVLVELATQLKNEVEDDDDPIQAITDPASKMTLDVSITKSEATERFLRTLECHFTWKLEMFVDKKFNELNLIHHLEGNLTEAKFENDDCEVFRVLQDLSYWFYIQKDFQESIKYQTLAAKMKLSQGELHVMKGNIAYMLYHQDMLKPCFAVIKSIVPYSNLPVTEKSIVYGIRGASTVELGDKTRNNALDQFEKAEILDPRNYRWPYWIGISLRRIRKIEAPFSAASEEEVNYLRRAVDLGSPSLFLACSLSETAFSKFKANGNRPTNEIKNLNQEVYDLVTDFIRNQEKSPKSFLRCGEILGHLPKYFRTDALVDHCYRSAIQSAPEDSMINHKYGKYVESRQRNPQEACKYYQKAMDTSCSSNYSAMMDYIRLKCELDKEWDVYEEMKTQLERVCNPCHKAGLYAAQADYLVDVDPEKALELYQVAVAMGTSSDNEDWGKNVIRFAWKLGKDGRRCKASGVKYTRQNIHAVIQTLEAQLPSDDED